MTVIITIDKLKLYNAYGGDIDGLLRINSKKHELVFGNDSDNAWAIITTPWFVSHEPINNQTFTIKGKNQISGPAVDNNYLRKCVT